MDVESVDRPLTSGFRINTQVGRTVDPGCTVLITGTGSIGLAAVALARQMGAARVILAGRRDAKLAIGREMGADVLVNTTRESLAEAARAHSYRGLGVDILLECSGAVCVMMEAPDCVHPQGVLWSAF